MTNNGGVMNSSTNEGQTLAPFMSYLPFSGIRKRPCAYDALPQAVESGDELSADVWCVNFSIGARVPAQ